mgnify:CR=1 FL=1
MGDAGTLPRQRRRCGQMLRPAQSPPGQHFLLSACSKGSFALQEAAEKKTESARELEKELSGCGSLSQQLSQLAAQTGPVVLWTLNKW